MSDTILSLIRIAERYLERGIELIQVRPDPTVRDVFAMRYKTKDDQTPINKIYSCLLINVKTEEIITEFDCLDLTKLEVSKTGGSCLNVSITSI